MAGIITQVSQTPVQANIQPPLLTRLSLDLRGRRFNVDRETIMNLPESVLLCLFPNGLVLSRQATSLTDQGEHAEEEEVYGVDVRCRVLLLSLIWRLNLAECSSTRSHLLPPSFTVRPRLLFLRPTVLPLGFRYVLWDRVISRSLSRTAATDRRIIIQRLRSQPESPPLKASHHRPTRGVGILFYSSQKWDCFHGCEWNCQREHAQSQARVWQVPSRKEEHIYGATTQRQQGKQHCGAASYRHVVHEVTSCLFASRPSNPCVLHPPTSPQWFRPR